MFVLTLECVKPVTHFCLLGLYFTCQSCMIVMPFVCVKTIQTFPLAFLKLLDLHEMELDLIAFLPLVHALFFFTFSSVSGIFGVSIMFGPTVWIRVLLTELNIKVFGRYLDKEYR